MDHSIELNIFWLEDKDSESFSEVPLEVTFDIDENNSYEITAYLIDSSKVSLNELKKDNPGLNKRICNMIDKYITNFEEEYQNEF